MDIKVSVWMSAYNHGKYIARSLDSVLMQITDFDFEVIIGEDCSQDDTRDIIIEYANKYPEIVKPYLPEKNIGMMQMDVATFPLCKGKYLALLNGDDEWTDENKLQIQADLLDSNEEISMCFHQSKVIDEISGQEWDTEFTGVDDYLPVEKLFHGFNPIMTASVMCRNIGKLPDWYIELPYGDMPLYLILSEMGKISYINKVMCLYRIHASGNWQGDTLKSNLLKDIKYYKVINEKFGCRYNNYIKEILALRNLSLVIFSIRNNDLSQAKDYYTDLMNSKSNLLDSKKNEIKILENILYYNISASEHSEIINTDPGWKIL